VLHYLTIELITEEQLSSPLNAQPELLRALLPDWLQGFQDDIAAAGDMDDSDSGNYDEAVREPLATGYNPDDDIFELPSMPVWVRSTSNLLLCLESHQASHQPILPFPSSQRPV
jgi:hypothetical protein